ncbi:MAG TPA: AAA family ATPase [Candidatus Limnocylindrales bacterium]
MKGKIMLRSFRVANHKSIRDEQELVLLPSYDKARAVVPVAAIFGANASGKSNLLDSIAWLRNAVLHSFASWLPGSGVPRRPFALDPAFVSHPTTFEVELLLSGTRHAYSVQLDDSRVLREQLTTYPNRRPRLIFKREGNGVSFGSTIPESRGMQGTWSKLTRENALFLTVAALNDVEEVGPLFQWFRAGCTIALDDANFLMEPSLAALLNSQHGQRLIGLIQAADIGVKNVGIQVEPQSKTSESAEAFVTHLVLEDASTLRAESFVQGETRAMLRGFVEKALTERYGRVVFDQGSLGVKLGLEDQSAGTRSWIRLVCLALSALTSGGVLVVDEVDASLHTHLSAHLINLFRDEETNRADAQLIFTTHDSALLDDEVLARDEVWFVEKDDVDGASRLFPLTDFHPRKNENTQGRYLAGSYGAVPVLSDYRMRSALRGRDGKNAA